MIYVPSEDTFLLADCIRQYRGERALEIGVGSGLLLSVLQQNFKIVVGSDIDLNALRHCTGRSKAMLVCCDAAFAFRPGQTFDLIVSNPPYLPDDAQFLDSAVHGGPTGIEKTVHFMRSALPLLAPGGRMLVVVSTLADSSKLDGFLVESNMQKTLVKEKKLFYETLSVFELST